MINKHDLIFTGQCIISMIAIIMVHKSPSITSIGLGTGIVFLAWAWSNWSLDK